ncbi:MAG: hypothetical protein R6W78_17840, partial [Bacteroidales bacterium]
MKTFKKLLICMAFMTMLVSCEKDYPIGRGDFDPNEAKTFDAEFIVQDFSQNDVKWVSDKNGALRVWKGEGSSSLYGE